MTKIEQKPCVGGTKRQKKNKSVVLVAKNDEKEQNCSVQYCHPDKQDPQNNALRYLRV
jgi:hypothetical protein